MLYLRTLRRKLEEKAVVECLLVEFGFGRLCGVVLVNLVFGFGVVVVVVFACLF